jgi:hypothetical protein
MSALRRARKRQHLRSLEEKVFAIDKLFYELVALVAESQTSLCDYASGLESIRDAMLRRTEEIIQAFEEDL